jgi:hypothetical protein
MGSAKRRSTEAESGWLDDWMTFPIEHTDNVW